jgi:hypothetical protein
MSNIRRSPLLIGTMIVVGMGLAAPAAHAFNPQPDPPAKSRLDTKSKTNGSDKVIAPGLLDSSTGFSTNGPAATGTPLGGGVGVGGPKGGGAAIK